MKNLSDYNKVVTQGFPDGLNQDGECCPDCGEPAKYRICADCQSDGHVIDCGHFAQPRPIAPGKKDGSQLDRNFCADCA